MINIEKLTKILGDAGLEANEAELAEGKLFVTIKEERWIPVFYDSLANLPNDASERRVARQIVSKAIKRVDELRAKVSGAKDVLRRLEGA